MNYVTLLEVAHYLRSLPKQEFVELTSAILNLSTLTLFDLDDRVADVALAMGRSLRQGFDRAFAAVDGIEVVDAIPRGAS